jgi:hypothetical protein
MFSNWMPETVFDEQRLLLRLSAYILRCKSEHSNRASDVLDSLLTKVSESYREVVPNLVVRRPRDTHAAGLAQRFQRRCQTLT